MPVSWLSPNTRCLKPNLSAWLILKIKCQVNNLWFAKVKSQDMIICMSQFRDNRGKLILQLVTLFKLTAVQTVPLIILSFTLQQNLKFCVIYKVRDGQQTSLLFSINNIEIKFWFYILLLHFRLCTIFAYKFEQYTNKATHENYINNSGALQWIRNVTK